MPSNQMSIQEIAPIYGMNTVDDARTLRPGQCVRLLNALPGNPPQILNGSTGSALVGTNTYRFIPPGISFEYGAEIYAVVWVYDATSTNYKLIAIKISNKTFAEYGDAAIVGTQVPMFDFINIHSCIYAVSNGMSSWKGSANSVGIKVIEGPATVRALSFSYAAAITSVTRSSGSVFTLDKFVQYAFQYVRKNDATSFTTGTPVSGMILPPALAGKVPITATTFLPGAMIGPEDTANRKSLQFTTGNQGAVTIDIDYAGDHAKALAQGATHIRVSRSLEQDSLILAEGATKFFLFDLPLLGTGTTSFTDSVTNASLSGEDNQLITGYTSAPDASFVEYVKGRLFLMTDAGLVYYSESVGGDGGTNMLSAQSNPQAWASLFNPILYFLDCDKVDSQLGMGMKRLGDDLFMWKERKIFALFGGDPSTPLSSVSNTIGCAFPYTITKAEISGSIGNCILFLSNEGPMIMQEGGRLRPFSEFKIKELWPTESDDLYSELDTNYDWAIHNCSAVYFRNIWWILYKKFDGTYKMFGYYFNPDKGADSGAPSGPFEFTFAEM